MTTAVSVEVVVLSAGMLLGFALTVTPTAAPPK
jgi:hypothetical protein